MIRLAIAALFVGFCTSATAATTTGNCPQRSTADNGAQYAWKCNTCCRRRGLQYVCGCC
jgi:hypothetical protein